MGEIPAPACFFSDPAPGRTSGNRGNIEKQVPRPSEEGHGARSGESDVGWCGQAACVVTAVYSSTAVGACPRVGVYFVGLPRHSARPPLA